MVLRWERKRASPSLANAMRWRKTLSPCVARLVADGSSGIAFCRYAAPLATSR